MTGNFRLFSVMELVEFLTGKQKFQWGNNRNKAGKVFRLELSGEKFFLTGNAPLLAGHHFSGIVTGVCE